MRKFAIRSLAIVAITLGGISAQTAISQTMAVADAKLTEVPKPFIKKRYSIKGEWSLVESEDGKAQIRFSENFKTKGGPDLKVYLSKITIDDLNSESASKDTRSIGVLKSKSGAQIYTLPDDINLSEYKSVIIHCEAFSVLWGGFDLPANFTPKP